MTLKFEADGKDRKLVCDCFASLGEEPGLYDDFRVFIDHNATISVMCPECGCKLILKGAYIDPKILKEKDQGGFQKASEIEEPEMTITEQQADYWLTVARKDISEDMTESAWNVYRWLKENNAIDHAQKLKAHIIDSKTAEVGSAACEKDDDDDGY